jgi:hypothetical protein
MNNRNNLILNISDITICKIAKNLGKKDLINLTHTNKVFCKFFKAPLLACAATHLMPHVINANWSELIKQLNDKPALMFIRIKMMDIDGKKKTFSPVGYLSYVQDFIGLTALESIAREHHVLKEYLKELQAPHHSFDNKPFLKSYEDHLTCGKNNLFKPTNKRVTRILNDSWRERICSAQQKQLPRHIFRLMCAKQRKNSDFAWNIKSEFNDSVSPSNQHCTVSNWRPQNPGLHVFKGSSLMLKDNIGLLRGRNCERASAHIEGETGLAPQKDGALIEQDLKIIQCLFEIRSKQLNERISRLEQEIKNLEIPTLKHP